MIHFFRINGGNLSSLCGEYNSGLTWKEDEVTCKGCKEILRQKYAQRNLEYLASRPRPDGFTERLYCGYTLVQLKGQSVMALRDIAIGLSCEGVPKGGYLSEQVFRDQLVQYIIDNSPLRVIETPLDHDLLFVIARK